METDSGYPPEASPAWPDVSRTLLVPVWSEGKPSGPGQPGAAPLRSRRAGPLLSLLSSHPSV
eukprot:scaffold677951_cov60-Prasinocladus_malaysianus.AAC.1